MKPRTEKVLVDWLSKYIDDVTTVHIAGDRVTMKVKGKTLGIIVMQRL